MKLLRVGKLGKETVAVLDSDNKIRDLSEHIKDLHPKTLNEATLEELKKINFSKLKELDPKIRTGSCISNPIDFLSNGFKWRVADSYVNGTGDTNIYMAFAENPFVTSTGIPATAR